MRNAPIHLILIDANVFMYIAGRAHPLKEPSRTVLGLAADYPRFFTDAEVLQELLHRYISLGERAKARAAVTEARSIMGDRIEPVLAEDVRQAADLANRYTQLSARDLIHVAVARRAGASHIVSADTALDVVTEIGRLDPLHVADWGSHLQ